MKKIKQKIKKDDWSYVPKKYILEQNPELKNKIELLDKRTGYSKSFNIGLNKDNYLWQ